MANWKHIVDFKKFWVNDDIKIIDKAKMAANELKLLLRYYKNDDELEMIIEDFENVSGDGEPTETTEFTITEDFDARMYELYDWADSNRVWIKTHF